MSPRERSRATHNQSERIRSAEPPLSASFPAWVDAELDGVDGEVKLPVNAVSFDDIKLPGQRSGLLHRDANTISVCFGGAKHNNKQNAVRSACQNDATADACASCNTIRLSRRHTDGLEQRSAAQSQCRKQGVTEVRVMFTMRSAVGLVVVLSLCYGWGAAAFGRAACQEITPKQFAAEATRTAKERLSGKSADEQRVDNCKVPLGSRGCRAASPILCRSRSKPLKRRPKVDRLVTFAVTEITGTGAVPLTVRWQIDILQRR